MMIMKSIEEFLLDISSLDIKIKIDGDRLYCNAPEGQVTPELRVELQERKTEILEFLHNNTNFVSSLTYSPIVPVPRDTNLPLSFAQQRLWFVNQLEPNSTAYNFPFSLHISGALNVAALEQSFNKIVQRHETLRTTFRSVNGHPNQVINPTFTLKLSIVDLQEYSTKKQKAEVLRLAIKENQLLFNLTQGPLLRANLLHLSEQQYVLLLTMHHLVFDGWSIGLFIKEVIAHYNAFCKGKPSPFSDLPIQYVDFAVWQRQWLQGEVLKYQIYYWRKQLEDAPRVLDLPTDYPRPAIRTFQGATYSFELSQKLSVALNTLSQQQKSTLFMTLLASFQILLWRYTGSEDIVVGSPIANRNRDEIKELIGFFLNILVLRTNLTANPSFEELLFRVREMTLGAYAHEDLPFELLLDELQPQRSLSYTPLFQVAFVLQNAPISTFELPGLTLKSLKVPNVNADFDLSLDIAETEEKIYCKLHYNANLFEAATIKRMAGHFHNLLKEITSNPKLRLSELRLLTESEQHQLLEEWNNTQVDYAQDKCIHELFEAQVEKTPLSVAVVFEDQQLTYLELNSKANQLAHHLRSLGVKPEVLVGICVERSLDMVIGLLAILKAGGAYVPLDPNYPQERLAYMLEDSQPSLLLTQQYLLESLPSHQAQVICIDSEWEQIVSESTENPASNTTIDNLAYIIYTSGSTGKPKGAMLPHRAICNHMFWMQSKFPLTQTDKVLQKTPFSFDASVWEFYAPLLVGAQLIMAQPRGHQDSDYLVQTIIKQHITIVQLVPSLLQILLAHDGIENCQSIKRVFCGGEPIPIVLREYFFAKLNAQLHNLYGPTETCIDVISWTCNRGINQQVVPIGRPIDNIQIYLLDKYLNPVPIGVTGEVYIGGVGVARCYLNRPDLSAEKFIPNPFSTEATRLYKTGDLARYLPSGDIEYIGRIDNQVKVRGFRIELGEIEAVVSEHPAVREAVVLVREDSLDFQRIVAYVVPQKEQTLVISELRSFLESKLPNYMLPAAFVTLEALPLTPNGKVDRKALSARELTQVSSSNIVPASTPIENLLAGIWAEVLGIEKVGINNNFFELGGHSLIATRVISQIRQVFQLELPLRSLFEKPTIAGLAKEIEKAIKLDTPLEATSIEPIPRSQQLPLSFAQQRLWFLAQLEPDSSFYNIPAAVRLEGELNLEALQKSFNEIVRRHEALRTNFQTKEGEAIAVISEDVPLTLPIFDISELSAFQQKAEIRQQAFQEAQRPFDLSSDHLLRLKLLRLGEQEHIVLLTMHHIISDAWSTGVLIEEIAALYPAFCVQKPSPLSELSIQYADFAVWQRQWLQGKVLQNQLDYWKQQLGNEYPRLALPKPPKLSSHESSRGAKQSFTLSKDLTEAINLLSRKEGVTLFMTLLAVFQVLLHCFTGTEDIRVGSPIANRNRVEIEKLIGFFINTLVLRIDLSGNPTFRELLTRSRQVTLEAYAHQDLPFEKLVEELQPERNLNHSPLYQAWFVLQNAPMPQLELPGLNLTTLEIERDTVRHDLLLSIGESSEGLDGKFEYKTNLFDEATISRLIEHFKTVINHVVAQPDTTLNEIATILTQSDEEQQKIQKQELQVTERQKLKMIKRKTIRK
ncbi:MAG: amino acid adenylation domain-containing protein [Cyanobacteria bacterium P01_H01_bin.150]